MPRALGGEPGDLHRRRVFVEEAAQGVDQMALLEEQRATRKDGDGLGRRLGADRPPIPYRVPKPIGTVGLEEVVRHVHDVDHGRDVAVREHLFDHRVVLEGAVGRHAAVQNGPPEELFEHGRERLVLLHAEAEDLRVAHHEHLVVAGGGPLPAAISPTIDPDVGDRVVAELQPLGGPRLHAHTEVGVGDVDVHVGESAVVPQPECALGDDETQREAERHRQERPADAPLLRRGRGGGDALGLERRRLGRQGAGPLRIVLEAHEPSLPESANRRSAVASTGLWRASLVPSPS